MSAPPARDPAAIKRALLELKIRQRLAEKAEAERIRPVPRGGKLAIAEQQRYLWFLHQLAPKAPTYNVSYVLRLTGELDLAALAEAVRGLVARHESLRTRFGSDDGVPYQVIDPAPESWPLPVTEGDEADVQEWIDAEAAAPFDLDHGPVLRSAVLRTGPRRHVLALTWHHVINDGWSASRIADELAVRYDAARAGTDPGLPPLAVQPADYAAWQRERLGSDELAAQIDYWRETLQGVPTLDFPSDRPRPAQPTGAGRIAESAFDPRIAAAVRALANAEGTSLLAVLLAAFCVVLHRYTGQDDIAVGTALPGRTRTEVEPMVGFFANTVVLRNRVVGGESFRELVRRCGQTVLDASAHQDVPLGMLVEALQPERIPGVNPLFQVVLSLLPAPMVPRFRFGDAGTEPLTAQPGTSRFDLALQVTDEPDGRLTVWVEHSTELFTPDRIERLVRHLGAVLRAAAAAPESAVDALPLLSEEEREQLLTAWQPEPVVRPAALLHEVVADRAAAQPDHHAMRFEGATLTYAELDRQANALAHRLVASGAPGTVVGILLERGFGLPVGELGILRSGAAWLALDPQYPAERLAYQLANAGVGLVVTTEEFARRLPAGVTPVLLDGAEDDLPPPVRVHPEDTAYVIYTSGSTGKPKGVAVPHRAVVNFCRNVTELFRLSPDDKVLQFSNPSFDVSVSDFFSTFTAGATVVGAPRTTLLDPDALQELMHAEGVSFVDIPPAVLRLLDPSQLPALRVCFIGMEPFPASLVNAWQAEEREFHNGYGPTEVTITCVDYRCPPERLDTAPPIGRAMANHRAYVLDPALRPVPVGIPGELYMAGAGLAHGYLGRGDLTAEKFIPDPFSDHPGDRMYATGDVVRWRADGQIEFVGRVDRQVKLRGLRIELGEVEHAIASHPGVSQAVVTVQQPGTPDAYLVGYVVGTDDTEALRRHLTEQLPVHMVPALLMPLDALPLTPLGKLDYRRLPDPAPQRASGYVAPATDSERKLAEVWHQLLAVERISSYDNFFGIGGNSLQATQLISRIRDAFGVTLDPRQLFAHPTLEGLAAQIDEAALPQLDPAELAELEAEIAGLSEEEIDRMLGET